MTGSGSPCGACKFLRRKCAAGCVFAPHFSDEEGAAHFAAVHRVFGASNASKLLARLPASDRADAALSISYEAQARLHNPVYGCVAHIFALRQRVVTLEAQLASVKAQTARDHNHFGSSSSSSLLYYNGVVDSTGCFGSSQHLDRGQVCSFAGEYASSCLHPEELLQSVAFGQLNCKCSGANCKLIAGSFDS